MKMLIRVSNFHQFEVLVNNILLDVKPTSTGSRCTEKRLDMSSALQFYNLQAGNQLIYKKRKYNKK